jgi:hypothetical protein
MEWLRGISEAVSKLTDIFNLGRLIFYTAAGALLVYPSVAAVWALTRPLAGSPLEEIVTAGRCLDHRAMFLVALVAGFVIAPYGFSCVLEGIGPTVKGNAESRPVDRRSYPFRYPMLRNQPNGHDYDDWLIKEYFRFVEIVTYVPLGLLGGLGALTLYAAVYVVLWAASGHGARPSAPHATLVALAAVFALSAFYVWPMIWVPRVVAPVLHAYHRAKLAIIEALEERKGLESATTRGASAPPSPQLASAAAADVRDGGAKP